MSKFNVLLVLVALTFCGCSKYEVETELNWVRQRVLVNVSLWHRDLIGSPIELISMKYKTYAVDEGKEIGDYVQKTEAKMINEELPVYKTGLEKFEYLKEKYNKKIKLK